MLSYLNDPKIKTKYLRRVRAHRQADLLAQGETGSPSKGERGCAVACTLDRYDHKGYESELGLPEWLARLEDTIFEGLPPKEAMKWPDQFLNAIPVGVNLDRVRYRFALALLGENTERVKSLEIDDELKQKVLDAIEQVAAVNRVAEETGEWDESAAWSAAESAESAWSAAWSAAYIRYRDILLDLLRNA